MKECQGNGPFYQCDERALENLSRRLNSLIYFHYSEKHLHLTHLCWSSFSASIHCWDWICTHYTISSHSPPPSPLEETLHFLHWQVSSLLLMPIKHSKKAKQNKIEAENSPFLRALCSAQHRPNLTFSTSSSSSKSKTKPSCHHRLCNFRKV